MHCDSILQSYNRAAGLLLLSVVFMCPHNVIYVHVWNNCADHAAAADMQETTH